MRPRTRKMKGLFGAGVVLLIAGVATVAALSASSQPTYPPSPDSKVTEKLQAIAQDLGSTNADPAVKPPTTAEVVLSSHGVAMKTTSGDSDNTDPSRPVYVVQMTGSFIGYGAKSLDPESIKGEALTFIFDPAAGEITDWGIVAKAVDLGSLGEVSTISVNVTPAASPTPT